MAMAPAFARAATDPHDNQNEPLVVQPRRHSPFDPLRSSLPEWLRALRSAEVIENPRFARALSDKRVVVAGDSDHGSHTLMAGYQGLLPHLKALGFTHVAVELPSDLDVNDQVESAAGTWQPHRWRQFLKDIKSAGLEPLYIDKPVTARTSPDNDLISVERGNYMGERLVAAAAQKDIGRVLAFVGYSHLADTSQIQDRLTNAGIPVHRLMLVAAGQEHHIGPVYADSLEKHPGAMAISEATGGRSPLTYVDFSGSTLPIDGVLHFPEKTLLAPTLPALESDLDPRVDRERSRRASYEGLADRFRESCLIDFSEEVEPQSAKWRDSNTHKVLQLAATMCEAAEASPEQAAMMALSLSSYVTRVKESLCSGSFVQIAYNGSGQFFEISSVDTFGYPYDGESGVFKHWEIGLKELVESFGIDESTMAKALPALESLLSLPASEGFQPAEPQGSIEVSTREDAVERYAVTLTPAAGRPESIGRMLALGVALSTSPDHVSSSLEEVTVYRDGPAGKEVWQKLSIDDFDVEPHERMLMDVQQRLLKMFSEARLLHYKDPSDQLDSSRTRGSQPYDERVMFTAVDTALQEKGGEWYAAYKFRFAPVTLVTAAHAQGKVLDQDGVEQALKWGYQVADSIQRAIEVYERQNAAVPGSLHVEALAALKRGLYDCTGQMQAFGPRPAEEPQTDPQPQPGRLQRLLKALGSLFGR